MWQLWAHQASIVLSGFLCDLEIELSLNVCNGIDLIMCVDHAYLFISVGVCICTLCTYPVGLRGDVAGVVLARLVALGHAQHLLL